MLSTPLPPIPDRVAAGAALLDVAWAKDGGWESRVDLRTLNLQGACNCILGQIYDDYQRGCDLLNLSMLANPSPHALGFYALDGFDDDEWEALENAWVALITERLACAS